MLQAGRTFGMAARVKETTMYLPRVDFIAPDTVPAAAVAVVTQPTDKIFTAQALNSVPTEVDAYRFSDLCADSEARLHPLVTFFE